MRKGLIKKFSILIVSILLINNFSFIPNVFADTLGTNGIDTKSEISFDLSEDKNNENHTDETLQSEDKNNESYTDKTLQNDDNKQQITKDLYNNNFETLPDKIKISELKTKIQNVNNNSIENIPAFASESLWPLNQNIPFKGGRFTEDKEFYNYFNKSNVDNPRIFDTAYVIRNNNVEKVEISAYFKAQDNSGNIAGYYVLASEKGEEPTIAYKMREYDSIQAHYRLKEQATIKYKITNTSANGITSEITPSMENYSKGYTIILKVKYLSNVKNIGLTVTNDNGAPITVKTHKEDPKKRENIYTFIMPASNVTIRYNPTITREQKIVGVQTNLNTTYEDFDLGYLSLYLQNSHSVFDPYDNTNFFDNTCTFGMENSRGDGLGITNPGHIRNWSGQMNWTHRFYVTNRGTPSPKDELIDRCIYTGIDPKNRPNAQDSKHGTYAAAAFNQGTELKFTLAMSRAKWNSSGGISLLYRYEPTKLFTIMTFENNNFEESASINYSVPLFQDKNSYEKQLSSGELPKNDQAITTAVNIANKDINGLYPVSTTLPNGMKITCYQNYFYHDNASGKANPGNIDPGTMNNNPNLYARRFSFTIKIENTVDSFLIKASHAPASQQFYQIHTDNTSFEQENGKISLQFFESKDKNIYSYISNSSVIIQNHPVTDFKMKIKNGYSYPYPYIMNFQNKIIADEPNNISKPKENGMGHWWIKTKNSGKIKTDTYGIKRSGSNIVDDEILDNYYHIRFNPALTGNLRQHSAYPIVLESKPLQFKYIFKDLKNPNKPVSTGNGINILDKKYFNVPSNIPKSNDASKEYFIGWKLTCNLYKENDTDVATGTTIDLTNNGKLYMPRDLIDISTISQKLSDQFTVYDVGKIAYTLNFEPQYSSTAENAVVIDSIWKRYIQSSYDDNPSTQNTVQPNHTGEKQVIKNEKLVLSYSTIYQDKYYLGSNSEVLERVTAPNQDFAKLYYYKGLTVTYSLGVGTGNPPIDNKLYITHELNKNQNLPSHITPLTHELKLPEHIAGNNKAVTGWKLINGSTETVYNPGETIDLSKASNDTSGNTKSIPDNARRDIFNTGQIKLEAVYDTPIKIVHDDGSDGSIKEFNQVGVEGQDVIIQAKFKFVNMNGNNTNYKFEQVRNKIKFVLLKKNRGQDTYNIWNIENTAVHPHGYGNNNQQLDPKAEITYQYDQNDTSGKFTINIRLKSQYLGSRWDHTADFRIVPFTENNKGMKGITSNQLGNTLQNGNIDFEIYKVPIVSTMLYFGTPTEIIQYPKKVVMFDKQNGTLDSDIEQIKLLPYTNNNSISHNLPNPNVIFTVKVANSDVIMSNSSGRQNFTAKVVQSGNQSPFSNNTLGQLKYTKGNNNRVTSNTLEFRLYYPNNENKKLYDGELYTGRLTFQFEQSN